MTVVPQLLPSWHMSRRMVQRNLLVCKHGWMVIFSGLFEPVLTIAAEEMTRADARARQPLIRIGGICGPTEHALREAELLVRLGYHAGLLSLAALADAPDTELIAHQKWSTCRMPAL